MIGRKRPGSAAIFFIMLLGIAATSGVYLTATSFKTRDETASSFPVLFSSQRNASGMAIHTTRFEEMVPLVVFSASEMKKTIGVGGAEYRMWISNRDVFSEIARCVARAGVKMRSQPLGGLFTAFWTRGEFPMSGFIPNIPSQSSYNTFISEMFLFIDPERQLRERWKVVQELAARHVSIPVVEYIW